MFVSPDNSTPHLSLVIPAHNEQDSVRLLIEELDAVLQSQAVPYEIIIVDDCSTDDTPAQLRQLLSDYSLLRVIRLCPSPPGRGTGGNGQSAAFHAGIRVSCGPLICTLDADLQNDPADIPRLLALLLERPADLVQGDRTQSRRDPLIRRFSSGVGRFFRRLLLNDSIRDTGCSLRIMKREVALALPLEFRGMHRFIPGLARRLGFAVVETPVRHRPRRHGQTNYGIWNRAIPGLVDCFAVRWMHRRRRPVSFTVINLLETVPTDSPSPSYTLSDSPR